jgi:hypothetical protein
MKHLNMIFIKTCKFAFHNPLSWVGIFSHQSYPHTVRKAATDLNQGNILSDLQPDKGMVPSEYP